MGGWALVGGGCGRVGIPEPHHALRLGGRVGGAWAVGGVWVVVGCGWCRGEGAQMVHLA